MLFNLVTIPSPASMMTATTAGASMQENAGAMFTELLPYALAVVGFALGALILRYIVFGGFAAGVKKLVGKGRRGGRRRR